MTTVTLVILVDITYGTDTKTELREGRRSPSRGKEHKAAHARDRLHLPENSVTAVSLTQNSTGHS